MVTCSAGAMFSGSLHECPGCACNASDRRYRSFLNRGTYHLFPSPSLPPRPTLHQISASYPFRESNELGASKWPARARVIAKKLHIACLFGKEDIPIINSFKKTMVLNEWIRIYDPQMPSRAGPWPIGWMTHDSSAHGVTQYVFQCYKEVPLTKRAGREPSLEEVASCSLTEVDHSSIGFVGFSDPFG